MQVEFHLPEDVVEAFAIRIALGNNGGTWLKRPDGEEHYTPEQKEHWRKIVRDLAIEVRAAHSFRTVEEAPLEF